MLDIHQADYFSILPDEDCFFPLGKLHYIYFQVKVKYNYGMTKMVKKVKSKWDNLSSGTQKLASLVTSIIVIGSALFGVANYIVGQLDYRISSQTSAIRDELSAVKLSTTRNELILLMEHNPKNIIEIERLAKLYFVDMNGDFYMTSLYSSWAKEYGGDTSFVLYH